MSQSLSLSEFFLMGKMDAGFEISERYVTGICVLYAERTAEEREYMIREKSIVALAGRELSECVQEAKDLACRSAIRRLSDMPAIPAAEPAQEKDSEKPASRFSIAPQKRVVKEAPAVEPEPEEQLRPDDFMEERSISFVDESKNAVKSQNTEEPILSSVKQVGFADLRPASSLLKEEPTPVLSSDLEADKEDEALEKARAMKISIVGKVHQCYGWTAGKILNEAPEVIVEFANRYNGPRTEERDALRALYTEALRRVNRAA